MSNFADAIMNNMIAAMDPQLHMQRDAMSGFLENQKLQLKESVARTAATIGTMLQQAIEDNADPVIITTYKELLQSLT